MNLVKIDGKYINTDRVDGLFGVATGETNIFVGGSDNLLSSKGILMKWRQS